MDSSLTKIVVICGPTAVGKTGFAIRLARVAGGEIVGADSMQIYRRMDIGTAKPTADERASVAHHMVDIVDPDEEFDAAAYAWQADACISELIASAKVPFVVGGTGLYVKALIHGLTEAAPADASVREQLNRDMQTSGLPALHRRLQKLDPESAKRIHPNDRYRILRALEVFEITGKSISAIHQEHRFAETRYDALMIGLTMPREQLYERIDKRVDIMLKEGLLDEVRNLLESGVEPQMKSMQSLGYRHMADYIRSRISWEEAVRTMKRDHRRYAKRQMTWFGANPDVKWISPDQHPDAQKLISDFLH